MIFRRINGCRIKEKQYASDRAPVRLSGVKRSQTAARSLGLTIRFAAEEMMMTPEEGLACSSELGHLKGGLSG